MDDERWNRIKKVLECSMEMPPQERASFLSQIRDSDEALYKEVVSLLDADAGYVAFLEQSVVPLAGCHGEMAEGQRIGSYKIIRELGRGGMGTVYLATRADEEYEKQVAVKVLKRGMETERIIRRFRVERQILANLDHPNIARLFDGGTTGDGLPYLVMEYVEGKPIHHYCDAHKLSTAARLELIRKVCSTVHVAHQNLIVHRDLKPGNILVTPEGEPKLLDFGIAKLLQPAGVAPPTLTVAGLNLMTPEYASPEQVRGETITTATDIYALGVLSYELLTGRRPYRFKIRTEQEIRRVVAEEIPEKPSIAIFREETLATTGDRVITTPQPSYKTRGGDPRKLRRSLTGDVDNIVLMALRKEPQRRYSSAQELAEDMGRYLKGFPVSAGKESFSYLALKFVRRHRFGVATAAAGLLLVLGFLVAMAFQQRQILRERDRSQRVSEFLVNIFEAYDPYEANGQSVTAKELLDNTAKNTNRGLEQEPEIRADLMDTMGRIYTKLELYDSAQNLLEEALSIRQKNLGAENPDTINSQFHLARLLMENGNHQEAQALYNRVLALRIELQGAGHLQLAEVYNGIAAIFHVTGKFSEARDLYRKSMAIQEKASAGETAIMAETLNNLAESYYQLGEYREAEEYYRRSRELVSRVKGTEHPQFAMVLTSLGKLFRQQEKYDDAERLFSQALEIRERVVGPASLIIADSLNNLGLLYRARGQYEKAEPLLIRALGIKEQKLGLEHSDVAWSLNNLAWIYMSQKRFDEAMPLHRRALEIREKALGPNSPTTASSLNNLANAYLSQDKYKEAEPLYRRGLAILEQNLGPDHLHVSYCLHGLGDVYLAQGKLRMAEPLYQRALRIRERRVGPEHALIADVLASYAKLLKKMNRNEEARACEARAEKILATLEP